MDVPMERVREIAMRLQRGGVGYYPTAGTPFVHLDVGGVRAWPRMSYDQLARLFPDGKTVHIPSNGHPLAGYEQARAELQARNGTSLPTVTQVKSKGFFATLFGLRDDEDAAPPAAPAATGRVPRAPRVGGNSRVAAFIERARTTNSAVRASPTAVAANGNDASGAAFYRSETARQAASLGRAQSNLPRGATAIGPAPVTVSAPPSATPPAPAPPGVVANLDLRPAPDGRTALADAPLPPRRPADLAADGTLAEDVPLPPSRPVEFARASGEPPAAAASPMRAARSGLPAVITTGSSAPVVASLVRNGGAMAFAPSETRGLPDSFLTPPPQPRRPGGPGLHASAGAPVQPVGLRAVGLRAALHERPAPVAARLDQSNYRLLTSPEAIGRSPAAAGSAPADARRHDALRVNVAALVLERPAGLASRFDATAGDLSYAGFSGPAVRPLTQIEGPAAKRRD
jgi:hypothetical protein